MSHPCDDFSCPEYNQGQCFGDGCALNPAPGLADHDHDVPFAEDEEEGDAQ